VPPADVDNSNTSTTRALYKINKATAAVAMLSPAHDSSYESLKRFFDIFASPQSRLKAWQATLFHDWSMQVLIARARRSGSQDHSGLIDDLFPVNAEAFLGAMMHSPGELPVVSQEVALITKFTNTRKYLCGNRSLDELSTAYSWASYLQGVSVFWRKHIRDDFAAVNSPLSDHKQVLEDKINQEAGVDFKTVTTTVIPHSQSESNKPVSEDKPFDMMAFLKHAEMAAQRTVNENLATDNPEASASYPSVQPLLHTSLQPVLHQSPYAPNSTYAQELAAHTTSKLPRAQGMSNSSTQPPNSFITSRPPSHNGSSSVYPAQYIDLSTTQIISTQAQYEKARQAASVKALPKVRPPPPSQGQRRPWSQEEESSLMAGLDRVQGPHWSQILAMYGIDGTISEVLKDRNQVQLKDKARNLKLFFLKSGLQVPAYLKHVTGDLKSRAPTQMTKNASRERIIEPRTETKVPAEAPSAQHVTLPDATPNLASPSAGAVLNLHDVQQSSSQNDDETLTDLLRQEISGQDHR